MNRKKLLLVDDDKDFLSVLGERLKSKGYIVFMISDPELVGDAVRDFIPDLILLDVRMPGLSGFEVKARLNDEPSTMAIPVIFLTANDSLPEEIKGFRLGADDYITKPFEPDDLLARIESVLSRREFYETLSLTDGLTGLFNTAFFKKQFSLFFNIAKRYKKIFSLLIVDIDKLKKINDTYGHSAGDCVLKSFASKARVMLRRSDIVTRYGGDEFAIIMPETDAMQANQAAARLRAAMQNSECVFSGTAIKFSVSMGAATYDPALSDESALFDLADKHLYEDKRSRAS